MKRLNLIVVCTFVSCLFSYGQEFPNYGTLNSEDINLKQCSFDKDANAVVLVHEAFSNYDDEHKLITNHHIRIKILNEKGFSAANISIPFYQKDEFELISAVEGMTINVVDNREIVKTKLERKSIFTQKINDRVGEVIFTFPAIHAGSIIDYKYCSTMKHYGGLEDWNFQGRLPVIMSNYTLIILPNVEFTYRVNKVPQIPITIRQQASVGGIYFEMKNIPGLGDETYMDAREDYLQKVIFQLSGYGRRGDSKSKYMTSWDEVTRELNSSAEFGNQLEKSIPGTEDFIKQVNALASPEEKMKVVLNYVRNSMVWDGIHSKYSIDGVKDAWKKKKGTSGDINLLLINLLKEVSLEVYPMIVSDRFHGKVDISYPFIDQFNSVLACVIINNKKYYLDATDKFAPPQLTPFNILNTTAFIVNRKSGGLVNIATDTMQYKEYITAVINLEENGTISGDVSIRSFDYARIKKLQDYTTNKNEFINKYLQIDETSIVAKNLELHNLENDSLPLEQNCKLSGNLDTAGHFSYLTLNLFTGFDTNPFLNDNRFSNINFGYKRFIKVNISIQLPPVYSIDEIPQSVKLSDSDQDIVFTRQLTYDKQNNILNGLVVLEFKKSLYDKEMYPVIKEMYQKIFAYLKELVVLKKK